VYQPFFGLASSPLLRFATNRRTQTNPLLQINPALQPAGDPLPFAQPWPSPATQPQPSPATNPALTPVTQPVLQLALNPQTQKCECPEPESERAEPRPSRIVAQVKAFARRMSQNSLDNLR
jgi:hypothetical protein